MDGPHLAPIEFHVEFSVENIFLESAKALCFLGYDMENIPISKTWNKKTTGTLCINTHRPSVVFPNYVED